MALFGKKKEKELSGKEQDQDQEKRQSAKHELLEILNEEKLILEILHDEEFSNEDFNDDTTRDHMARNLHYIKMEREAKKQTLLLQYILQELKTKD